MAKLVAVAGSKIFIGTRVAAKGEVKLSDFADQQNEWTEIDGWTAAGAVGDTQELITQNFINQNRTRQIKGTRVGGTMENTFVPILNDPGQMAFRQAIEDCSPYAFKIEWGAGCVTEGVVTITPEDDPAVVTWAGGHGLEAGSPIIFTPEGGDLPTGLSPDTVYYVIATGLTATTFSISATPGGAAIETTGAGSATSITATAQPAGETDMFYGLAMPGARQGGEANTAMLRTWSIAIDSNVVEV